eukprot:8206398-Pyramimonas_sp.AAC.1
MGRVTWRPVQLRARWRPLLLGCAVVPRRDPQRLGGRGSAVRHHLMLWAYTRMLRAPMWMVWAYTRMLRAPMWMLVTRSASVGAAVPFVTT